MYIIWLYIFLSILYFNTLVIKLVYKVINCISELLIVTDKITVLYIHSFFSVDKPQRFEGHKGTKPLETRGKKI